MCVVVTSQPQAVELWCVLQVASVMLQCKIAIVLTWLQQQCCCHRSTAILNGFCLQEPLLSHGEDGQQGNILKQDPEAGCAADTVQLSDARQQSEPGQQLVVDLRGAAALASSGSAAIASSRPSLASSGHIDASSGFTDANSGYMDATTGHLDIRSGPKAAHSSLNAVSSGPPPNKGSFTADQQTLEQALKHTAPMEGNHELMCHSPACSFEQQPLAVNSSHHPDLLRGFIAPHTASPQLADSPRSRTANMWQPLQQSSSSSVLYESLFAMSAYVTAPAVAHPESPGMPTALEGIAINTSSAGRDEDVQTEQPMQGYSDLLTETLHESATTDPAIPGHTSDDCQWYSE